MLPIAEEILTIVSDGRKGGLFFREFPTNCHFNRKIRDIIIKAGLPPHTEATSHTARHTFATTICLENGLPIETVSKMLGHRFISTTELYAKVSKSKIAAIPQGNCERLCVSVRQESQVEDKQLFL